ncbi:MAG: AAA family ATPase [Deltaproteobacteria bacterium]|jgi:predicted AAA+ superfamily ATPase|nr:AAA family ATPase [Deltaproteobacteria bacterium]
MKLENLSVTDRRFRNLRDGSFLNIHKTECICNILNVFNCSFCFLSRPRRFGKTLLLDTIRELFQGDRKLFRGLWIDRSDCRFEKHPVLNFNMAYAKISSSDDLIRRIADVLRDMSVQQDVSVTSNSFDMMLEQPSEGIYSKQGVGVSILVDECDLSL